MVNEMVGRDESLAQSIVDSPTGFGTRAHSCKFRLLILDATTNYATNDTKNHE